MSLRQVMERFAKSSETKMKRALQSKGKNKGKLYQTLKVTALGNDGKVSLQLSMEDYGAFVDKGRKPGKQPPLKSIIAWCKSKNIDKSLAFPIARKIGEKGIKGINFTSAFEDLSKLKLELVTEFKKTVTEEIKTA